MQVSAASLNFNDIDRCRGKLVSVPTPPPFTLGMDVCGVVDAVGDGRRGVVGPPGGGHHQDGARRHRRVRHRPDGLGVRRTSRARRRRGHGVPADLPDLAPGPVPTGSTAGRRDPGGALGGQRAGHGRHPARARPAGARVIAVAGGPREGCAVCLARRRPGHRPPRARTSSRPCWWPPATSGADVVYDLTGGDFVERSWRCTARGGRYLAVGFADDDENGMTGRPLRMACIGNIDIVAVMVAWADVGRPGHAPVRLQPVRTGRRRRDPRRPAAPGGRRVASGPSSVGGSPWRRPGAALDEHQGRRSLGRTVVEVAR